MSKLLRTFPAMLAATGLSISLNAMAATTNTNVGVTTNVIANCSVTSTPIAFGSYDPISATAVTAEGTLSIRCTRGTAPSVAMGDGNNFSGGSRRMTDGTAFLSYNVFTPASNAPAASCAGASTPYPSIAPGFVLTAAPSNAARSYNICGQIPASQDVSAGAYSDTVVATITF
ncbi:MAG: spore coat U domain-containing protein [Burkholderiales bacterium]|nr:spore coat U domain-containing protein [Burkholderiales bacterium]